MKFLVAMLFLCLVGCSSAMKMETKTTIKTETREVKIIKCEEKINLKIDEFQIQIEEMRQNVEALKIQKVQDPLDNNFMDELVHKVQDKTQEPE